MSPPHGRSRYSRYGCRCGTCRTANTRYQRSRNAARFALRVLVGDRWYAPTLATHGTTNGYVNYGCRCVPCTAANATQHARWSARRASPAR